MRMSEGDAKDEILAGAKRGILFSKQGFGIAQKKSLLDNILWNAL
jgi:hypothetical protein